MGIEPSKHRKLRKLSKSTPSLGSDDLRRTWSGKIRGGTRWGPTTYTWGYHEDSVISTNQDSMECHSRVLFHLAHVEFQLQGPTMATQMASWESPMGRCVFGRSEGLI